jgi:amidase
MTRTIMDAAILLDAIGGCDPADEFTVAAQIAGHTGSYAGALDVDGLKCVRLGVVRNAFGPDDNPKSAAVNRVIEKALRAAKSPGAKLIDVEIPNLAEHIAETALYLAASRPDVSATD